MDLRKVKKLIELLEDSELVEMEITEGDNTIRLSRSGGQVAMPVPQLAHATQTPVTPSSNNAITATDNGSPAAESGNVAKPSGHVVESPMVGTYYDASGPEATPYVKIGSKVKVGDTLCIIEAMKTFNQIEADADGVVTAISKSTGEPVEFGESLFVIG